MLRKREWRGGHRAAHVELIEKLQRLRDEFAAVIEKGVNILDELDGDPDLELEEEIGIEDLPHDQADEGNDEPSLGRGEDGNAAGRAWCIDGELDECVVDLQNAD